MIDHTSINVANLSASKQFYEAVLSTLGYVVRLDFSDAVGFGASNANQDDDPGGNFWITQGTPFNPRSHIAFRAVTEAQVVAFYETALAFGAKDNGAPGLRPHYHKRYFATFIFDPDGYNIEAVLHNAALEKHHS